MTQTASSLSGAGSAESAPTEISVVVRPLPPVIGSPANGVPLEDSSVAVTGTAVPGAAVTLVVDGTAEPSVPADASGHFASTISPPAGTHRLTAYQSIAGATSAPGATILIAVGDVTPPSVRFRDANGNPLRTLAVAATDETGATVDFAARVTAEDCVSPGVGCVSLTATCLPASGAHFPLGSTTVTCSATDATGNRGSASLVVTVNGSGGPIVTGADLVAEAQGPQGAIVNYQVAATGLIADCAPPGSSEVIPCTSWQPAYKGLGFAPEVLAIDPNDPTVAPDGQRHGALYAAFLDIEATGAHVLKSTDAAATWQPLASPPDVSGGVSQIVVGQGSPPSLYIPTTGGLHPGGLRISRDGGLTWGSVLDTQDVKGIAVDPADPAHMLAWTRPAPHPALFETRDAWATWVPASTDGLPNNVVFRIAVDPVTPGRLYATVQAEDSELVKLKLFRKQGSGAWEHLDVPPYPETLVANPAPGIWIAPALEGAQNFPTVFAGPVFSRDGGLTWNRHFAGSLTAVLFDRGFDGQANRKVYAAGPGNLLQAPGFDSQTNPYAWATTSFDAQPVYGCIVQEAADPQRLYSTYPGLGLFATADGAVSWAPALAPGLSLPEVELDDIGFDPVDSSVAYLASRKGGMFKKQPDPEGLDSWVARNRGLTDPFALQLVSQVTVDPFARNNVTFGGSGGLWKSLNAADDWTFLFGLPGGDLLGFDPLVPDRVYAVPASVAMGFDAEVCDYAPPGDGTHCFSGLPYLGRGGDASDGTIWLRSTDVGFPGRSSGTATLSSFGLQVIPGPRQTWVVSFASDVSSGGGAGGGNSVLVAQTNLALTYNPGAPPQQQGLNAKVGIGTRSVFFDRSDGTNSLFLGGGGVLYRASVDELLQHADVYASTDDDWHPLNTEPPTGPFGDFSQLVIDPGTGGQTMYTIGSGGTVWESHDGGHTWRRDQTAPHWVNWAKISPVDGALYGTVSSALTPKRGVPWKRTLATEVQPGARVVTGDLRPSCAGPDGSRASGPGSMFPFGATTITCTATDVFHHTTTQTLAVTVQDTTPPALVVPAQVTGKAPDGGTVNVTFDVGATDIVDESDPVTCSPASGSAFPIGVTTVTCTASDVHGNTARASFPVIVSKEGAPALAPPTLTTPGDLTVEATGSSGAAVDLGVTATTAGGAPLAAPCTPASGSTFPLGSTDVSCSATDSGVTPPLTVARSLRVTVRDTTAPALTVPGNIASPAEGASGARVSFTATATDAVDGAVVPVCVPDSGATFPLGTTLVTCRASDRVGNRATTTFQVTVRDLNPPVLHLADITVEATDSERRASRVRRLRRRHRRRGRRAAGRLPPAFGELVSARRHGRLLQRDRQRRERGHGRARRPRGRPDGPSRDGAFADHARGHRPGGRSADLQRRRCRAPDPDAERSAHQTEPTDADDLRVRRRRRPRRAFLPTRDRNRPADPDRRRRGDLPARRQSRHLRRDRRRRQQGLGDLRRRRARHDAARAGAAGGGRRLRRRDRKRHRRLPAHRDLRNRRRQRHAAPRLHPEERKPLPLRDHHRHLHRPRRGGQRVDRHLPGAGSRRLVRQAVHERIAVRKRAVHRQRLLPERLRRRRPERLPGLLRRGGRLGGRDLHAARGGPRLPTRRGRLRSRRDV